MQKNYLHFSVKLRSDGRHFFVLFFTRRNNFLSIRLMSEHQHTEVIKWGTNGQIWISPICLIYTDVVNWRYRTRTTLPLIRCFRALALLIRWSFVFHVPAQGLLLRFEDILSGSLTDKRQNLSVRLRRSMGGNFRGSVHYLNRWTYFKEHQMEGI